MSRGRLRGAAALPLLLAVGACVSEQPPSNSVASMLTEGPGGAIERVDCRLTGQTVRVNGIEYIVAVLGATSSYAKLGAVGGMSGSPIVDSRGRLIGVFALHLYFGPSPVFGVLPAEEVEKSWTRFAAAQVNEATESSTLSGPLFTEPGQSVMLLQAWGDMEIGRTGTISEVRGDHVALMGHGLVNCGPCEYALRRAPVVAVVPDSVRGNKVVADGPLLGVVAYDGAFGCIGVIGRSPDVVRVAVVRQAKGVAPTRRAYSVVRSSRSWRETVMRVLRDAIEGGVRESRPASLIVDTVVDGTTARDELHRGASVDDLTEAALAAVARAISETTAPHIIEASVEIRMDGVPR